MLSVCSYCTLCTIIIIIIIIIKLDSATRHRSSCRRRTKSTVAYDYDYAYVWLEVYYCELFSRRVKITIIFIVSGWLWLCTRIYISFRCHCTVPACGRQNRKLSLQKDSKFTSSQGPTGSLSTTLQRDLSMLRAAEHAAGRSLCRRIRETDSAAVVMWTDRSSRLLPTTPLSESISLRRR